MTFVVPAAAITGAMLGTLLIAAVASRVRSVATLILFGIGLSSFVGALMSLLLSLAPTPFTLAEMVNWTFGSVSNRSWLDLASTVPFMAVGAVILLIARHGYTALSLGDETALAMGLNVPKHRMITVIGTGLLAGGAVALAGGIGFVGIVAPHLVRPLTDHDPARSLVPSALLAGALVLAADIAIRLLPGSELRLGVVAALLGAPVFIWIAVQRNGGRP